MRIICLNCELLFLPKNPRNTKFCSRKCNLDYNAERKSKWGRRCSYCCDKIIGNVWAILLNERKLYVDVGCMEFLKQEGGISNFFMSFKRMTVGSEHPQSKLDEQRVKEIRKLYKKGKRNGLSKKYGVSRQTIIVIANRIGWKHI